MSKTFSNPRDRVITIILLVLCVLSAVAAALVGIDDNLPGILLALFSALAFVLAFTHPWRSLKKFLFLLLASVIGFILLIIFNIAADLILQNPATSDTLRDMLESRVAEAKVVIFLMLSAAAFLVGIAGSIVMFFRSRGNK